jgi:hypothetical protein
VRRVRESRFEDSNLFANFAGEREDSNPKAKDSNLCCQEKKKKLLKTVQIWATFRVDSNFIILKLVFKGIYKRSFSF